MLGVQFAVIDRGWRLGLGIGVGGPMEHIWFVVIQPQGLELGGGPSDVGPHDVRRVALVPLDSHRLPVGRRQSIGNWAVIAPPASRTPESWHSSSFPSSPLRAEVRAGLLLVVTLSDLVDVVGAHPGSSLHAGDAVAGLAAGVFGAAPVPVPAGGARVRTGQTIYFRESAELHKLRNFVPVGE